MKDNKSAAYDAIYAMLAQVRAASPEHNATAAIAAEVACVAVQWLDNELRGLPTDEQSVRLNLSWFAVAAFRSQDTGRNFVDERLAKVP